MPETTVYPTSPFRLGGRVYLRNEPMKGLTDEEIEFYKKRGVINTKAPKGSNLTKIASAPVAPMTTQDAPNKPPTPEPAKPPVQEPPTEAPAPAPVQQNDTPPAESSPLADAAKLLADRTRLAAERISTGKKGK